MGALTKNADLVYTLRFLTLLTTPWEETNAYKEGIIDKDGNKIKKPSTTKEKEVYNHFHRLVFNIKKLINKVPGGKSKTASYVAALALIKEKAELSDEALDKIIDGLELDMFDYLEESTWFITDDRMLSPGEYKLNIYSPKLINNTLDENCKGGDRIVVEMDNYPIKTICGIDIYEVTHAPTNQKIYVTTGELVR